MNRRAFIVRSAALSTGLVVNGGLSLLGAEAVTTNTSRSSATTANASKKKTDLYTLFNNPESKYHPFVRWWWNGLKLEKEEIIRELHLLKEAGVGGVEINSIDFPSTGDDLGIKSIEWLSDEWIEMLQVAFAEAKKLDMTCDLIVGSGWPFGSESLPYDERAQVMLIMAEELEGPTEYEVSRYHIFSETDPGVTDTFPGRTFEIVSLKLLPDPMSGLDQVTDLSHLRDQELLRVSVPEGKHVFYALVKVNSFASVINGAPGAAGPILNHMDKEAVTKYLYNMSDTIQKKTGPLSNHLRAFFCDSMELEGSNWTDDFAEVFRERRGYDVMPYLPFIMFKVGRLGSVIDDQYGAKKSPEFEEIIRRVRFDFEYTKAELLYERFTRTYLEWCRAQNVQSRAQAYGRGFFPLESSLGYDIPEGESWTTNWLRHKLGEEMSDEDYRRGRGYTMINKYVSSAAHLTGKRLISCEEMTNTYLVFNATLELLKIGSDQAIMSGITHSIWHGFNYSPPETPFPGWVQYGSYYNENNNWWPYFKYLNRYKARLSALLQHADMYTDIAILPANYDMWGEMGVQTDPFPEKLNVDYTSILWESINKNGGAADYVTEKIIQDATIEKGKLCYGPKKYGILFLPEVKSLFPETAEKLHNFVSGGGIIFAIECLPEKSLGLHNHEENDRKVKGWVEKMQAFPNRFILIPKPADRLFLEWYTGLQKEHQLPHYLEIDQPDRYLMQTRYQADDKSELFFFTNSHMHERRSSRVTFSQEITRSHYPWLWDPETGKAYRLQLEDNSLQLNLGPAESRIIVFNKRRRGEYWEELPPPHPNAQLLNDNWEVELKHSREDWVKSVQMETLQDLKDTEQVRFTGTAVYKKRVQVPEKGAILNLGKEFGVSELFVNGKSLGVQWYGDRVYKLGDDAIIGENDIEVHVITTMGNYLQTLDDNPTAVKYTNRKGREQEIQSMGLVGPVTLY